MVHKGETVEIWKQPKMSFDEGAKVYGQKSTYTLRVKRYARVEKVFVGRDAERKWDCLIRHHRQHVRSWFLQCTPCEARRQQKFPGAGKGVRAI